MFLVCDKRTKIRKFIQKQKMEGRVVFLSNVDFAKFDVT